MNHIYQLQKSDLKILRYIYRHKLVSLSKLQRKFLKKRKDLDNLIARNYIITNYELPCDSSGFPIGTYPPETLYYLHNKGMVEVESQQWFDWQFVLRNIILPIVFAVITTLLTIFLSAWLSPFQ